MVGVVVELWRYPVKSMLGEQVDRAEVSERGLVGDRGLAVLDTQTGKVASAKNPRLWRTLLTCSASLRPTGLAITGPDGSPMNDDALGQILGRTVSLIDTPPRSASLDRSKPEQVLEYGLDAPVDADIVQLGSAAPAGTFFDFAPIHLITTSTLASIARLSPRRTVEARRYRPNVVIETAGDGFPEHEWLGAELHVGTELVLRVVSSTSRCAVPTLAHGELPRDTHALRVLAGNNRIPALPGHNPEPCAGVYAQVVSPGRVGRGDALTVR